MSGSNNMLSFILADSSLELVPASIQDHPSVISHAKKMGKHPSEILLDNSWHFAAMKNLPNRDKRGRPDLVHICLLEACTIPLYYNGLCQIYIHTINNDVISVTENVRIPKSYHRFAGIMEKLFRESEIKSNSKVLLKIQHQTFHDLIQKIKPSKVIGLSSGGRQSTFELVAKQLDANSCVVVGGFQKGTFDNNTSNNVDSFYSVNKSSLEAHVVISRILYEYEKLTRCF